MIAKPPDTLVTKLEEPSRARRVQPVLFLVMQCDDLTRPAVRYPLGAVHAVDIGRASMLSGVGETLSIRLRDERVSKQHATLRATGRGWIIRDNQSSNGTFVNGEQVSERVLHDDDLIEIGHTFFVWRAALECADEVRTVAVTDAPPGLATIDAALEQAFAKLSKVASSMVPILISGETGTGKELIAGAIHALSGRGALVSVDCGALPPSIAAAELFGSRKGAYSGAEDRTGLIPDADGGTLFLDEIGNLSPLVQAMLLRVLENGSVRPVGANAESRTSLRVVAATNDVLEEMVAAGAFRADLHQRVAGYRVALPPLRTRAIDMGLVIAGLASIHGRDLRLDSVAARAIMRYPWPGNVRQLLRTLEVALSLSDDGVVRGHDLPARFHVAADPHAASCSTREELHAVLEQHGGNVAAVARTLSTSRTQIHRMAKRLGVDLSSYRS